MSITRLDAEAASIELTLAAREIIEDFSAIPRFLQQQYMESLIAGKDHGRVWRVGLMGYNARLESALTVLGALEAVLAAEGFGVAPHAAAQAAHAAYESASTTV